jgi:hypothetical protein
MYIVTVNCKNTSTAETHLRFQGYAPVSPVVVYITMDKCTHSSIVI